MTKMTIELVLNALQHANAALSPREVDLFHFETENTPQNWKDTKAKVILKK